MLEAHPTTVNLFNYLKQTEVFDPETNYVVSLCQIADVACFLGHEIILSVENSGDETIVSFREGEAEIMFLLTQTQGGVNFLVNAITRDEFGELIDNNALYAGEIMGAMLDIIETEFIDLEIRAKGLWRQPQDRGSYYQSINWVELAEVLAKKGLNIDLTQELDSQERKIIFQHLSEGANDSSRRYVNRGYIVDLDSICMTVGPNPDETALENVLYVEFVKSPS